MTFTPTPEQASIVEAVRSTSDSILISALAGAAKTSTLVLIGKALSTTNILSLAFNKKIAEEMESRLPSNCLSRTMNSVGHRVWAARIGRRLVVDTRKSYELLKEEVDSLPRLDKADAYEMFSDLLKLISSAKLQGWLPDGKFSEANHLISDDDFFGAFEEEPTSLQISLLRKVITKSVAAGFQGKIDFDDQIFLPTLFGGDFPKFPLVMVDEAQDLSPLNHAMLDKLVVKRIIAVGDEHQSIYAFRGADIRSMQRLRDRFSMVPFPLTISFRCPISVVELVRKHAPAMAWPEWAKQGQVDNLAEWGPESIPDSAAVICRNNAPLFKLALMLLRSGRGVKLVGTDLGPQLIKTLKKLGPETMTQEEVLAAISKWESERLKKSRSEGSVRDKADCLRVFAGFGETLSAAIAYADHLFKANGAIQLLSGHKAKGLEWDTVFHLDSWRVPSKWARSPDAIEQEKNIEYVINTRAKERLVFIDMEGWNDAEPEHA